MKTVIGIFSDKIDVEDAIAELRDTGFEAKDISIVMRDAERKVEIANDTGANVTEGAVSGAMTGAVLGGLAGLVSIIAIPGIGAFLIGGPIAAMLGLTGAAAATVSGAATGVLAGGLLGALVGLGLPKEEAEYYEERIKDGAILVAVPAITVAQQEEVMTILDDYDAEDVKVIGRSTNHLADSDVDDVFENEERTVPTTSRDAHYDETNRTYATIGSKGGRSTLRRVRRIRQ